MAGQSPGQCGLQPSQHPRVECPEQAKRVEGFVDPPSFDSPSARSWQASPPDNAASSPPKTRESNALSKRSASKGSSIHPHSTRLRLAHGRPVPPDDAASSPPKTRESNALSKRSASKGSSIHPHSPRLRLAHGRLVPRTMQPPALPTRASRMP